MSKLSFFTPTILDEAFIFTMGASVKKSRHPIGFFGTGLKYAIAGVLRLGGMIRIEQPHRRYEFFSKEETLRGEAVKMVFCNIYNADGTSQMDVRCPMTIDYGKTWEPWMYLRELYSNTMDENGEIVEGDYLLRKPTLIDGKLEYTDAPKEYTIIVVENDAIFAEWEARASFFLNKTRTPIERIDGLYEVYSGSSLGVFYRGINVAAKPTRSAYTYNILHALTLTENRTADSYWLNRNIQSYVQDHCRDAGIIDTILESSCDEDRRESQLQFLEDDFTSDLFRERALELYKTRAPDMPTGLAKFCERHLRDHEPLKVYKPTDLNNEEQQRFDTCKAVLDNAEVRFDGYDIKFSKDLTYESLINYRHHIVIMSPSVLDGSDWMAKTQKALISVYIAIRTSGGTDTDRIAEYKKLTYELINGVAS